jgi:hypothetical protein
VIKISATVGLEGGRRPQKRQWGGTVSPARRLPVGLARSTLDVDSKEEVA